MAKRVYGSRALLNSPGFSSVAAIVAEVAIDEYGSWGARVAISDCSRVVNLEFAGPSAGEDAFENDLYKIDVLLGTLKEFRKGLLKARRQVKP